MRIDWFTFVAQVLNFLVLVLLLRRFLYRPVIAAIDARRGEIRGRLREAAEERRRAEEEAASVREEKVALERERAERLARMETEVEEVRRELLEEVREEVEEARSGWRRTLERERESFLAELRERSRRRIYDAVRRALADLADESLEGRATDVFLTGLREMDEVDRDALRDASRRAGEELLVRSRFEVPEERRERVTATVREVVGPGASVRFETSPEVAWGIELRAGDHKVGWSVESYVADLEEEAAELLEAEAREAEGGPDGPFAEVAAADRSGEEGG